MLQQTELVEFKIVPDELYPDGDGVFALICFPEFIDKDDLIGQIEDCISSYCEANDGWTSEMLVNDVLGSTFLYFKDDGTTTVYDLDYKIVSPITYSV